MFESINYSWMTQVRWESTNGVKSDWFGPRGGWTCAMNQADLAFVVGFLVTFYPNKKWQKKMVNFILGVAPQTCNTFCLETKSIQKIQGLWSFRYKLRLLYTTQSKPFRYASFRDCLPNPTSIQLHLLVTQKSHLPYRVIHAWFDNHT